MKTLLSFAFACSGAILCAQNAAQVQLDLFAESDPLKASSTMADGGFVAVLDLGNERMLWRGTPQGTPQWARAFPQNRTQFALFPRPGGELYVIDAPASYETNVDAMWDSAHTDITVRLINPDGTETWSRTIHVNVLIPYELFPHFTVGGSLLPDGRLLLYCYEHIQELMGGMLSLMRINADGTLEWCKRAQGPALAGFEDWWRLPAELWSTSFRLASTSDGGAVGLLYSLNEPGMRTIKFDEDGSMNWAKRFTYTVTPQEYLLPSSTTLASGDQLFTFKNYAPSMYPNVMALRLSNDGDLVARDIYAGPLGYGSYASAVALPDGGWATAFNKGNGTCALRMDPNNEILWSKEAPAFDHAGFNLRPSLHSLTTNGNDVILGIALKRVHTILGTTDFSPLASALNGQDDDCLFEPIVCEHAEIPEDLFTTEDLASFNMIAAFPTITPGEPLGEAVPLGTTNLCASLVTVGEISGLEQFQVINNVLDHSVPLVVQTSMNGLRFSIVSPTGARVLESLATQSQGRIEIPISSLAAGAYVLLGTDRQGATVGQARIVVQ